MGEDPRDIQQRIEQTREEMGDTVDALASKADVPGRVRGAVADKKDAAVGKVMGAKDAVTGGAGTTGDLAGQAKSGARRGAGIARENPLGLAVGAVAVGFVAGMVIPSTRVEDERLGDVSDQVKDKVKETAQEAAERGKDVAQQAAESAKETAQESGREHAEELKASAQERAGEPRP
jgi:gas vesicle protein